MPLRERSKARRRDVILDAARDLLSRPGEPQFSMRRLAEAAEVSIATPYNLFGSKHAILVALLDQGSARLDEELSVYAGDGVGALLKAPELMIRGYDEAPTYFSNILSAAYQTGDRESRASVGTAPVQLWRKLTAQGIARGDLVSDIDADVFAVTYGELTLAHILVWAQGFCDLPELQARLDFGVALILSGVATGKSQPRLTAARKKAEHAWQAAWINKATPEVAV